MHPVCEAVQKAFPEAVLGVSEAYQTPTIEVQRDALIPVVTFFGLRIPNAFAGSVIMEAVFGIPGLGRWIIDAINFRDYPQLQVALLFIAVMVLVSNLLIDLLYGWLDPRVRFS